MKHDRLVTIGSFRQAVLSALDETAKEIFGGPNCGWQDQDLPQLFAAIDRHVESLAPRLRCELTD